MFQVLAIFWAFFGQVPDLSGLGSPKFTIREKASRQLQANMTWRQAIGLQTHPQEGLEVQSRVELALRRYWGQAWEEESWPYIDALNWPRPCESPNLPIVNKYLALASGASFSDPTYCGPLSTYRCATRLWANDLRRMGIPVPVIKAYLTKMKLHSIEWDQGVRRPMPMPPGN